MLSKREKIVLNNFLVGIPIFLGILSILGFIVFSAYTENPFLIVLSFTIFFVAFYTALNFSHHKRTIEKNMKSEAKVTTTDVIVTVIDNCRQIENKENENV